MNVSETKSLALRKASLTRHYGPDDPRTVEAAWRLAEAKAEAAEAEATRLRTLADAMADAGSGAARSLIEAEAEAAEREAARLRAMLAG